jgi:hypothetical protein
VSAELLTFAAAFVVLGLFSVLGARLVGREGTAAERRKRLEERMARREAGLADDEEGATGPDDGKPVGVPTGRR